MRRKTAGRNLPTGQFEEKAYSLGYANVAGVDEAGRGPLAGPVVAAAVVIPSAHLLTGLKDSKLLSSHAREKLFLEIINHARVSTGVISSQIIDQMNILQATRQAMTLAIMNLEPRPDYLLIDGPISLDLCIPQEGIVKGDRLSLSIAAASIIAKVTRDRIMIDLHESYPQYGFDRHKGYPTKEHFHAITTYGPCPVHRKSFRGVKEFVN